MTLEYLRALGNVLALPFHLAGFLITGRRRLEELRSDLAAPAAVDQPDPPTDLPQRPLRLFVSCAEASGETHAVSLVHALRAELEALGAPPPEIRGLGGSKLRALGVPTIGDPVSRAAMGTDVVGELPFYTRLLSDSAAELRRWRPDVCVPVDSPALHVPLARMARAYGVPVVHFVSPQLWGWAPWRVHAYRRAVDRTLTILPFEPAWFARAGVPHAHVGHPHLDALTGEPAGRATGAGPLIILPGSRKSIVGRNLPWMLVAAARLRLTLPDQEVVVLVAHRELEQQVREHVLQAGAADWARIECGELHRNLARARAAFTVSGTVLIDLLHHRLPSVVVYVITPLLAWGARHFLTAPWFASVNLLADREVLPEFSVHDEGPLEQVVAALQRALTDEAWRAETVSGLEQAARYLGPRGAARRAALHALAEIRREP